MEWSTCAVNWMGGCDGERTDLMTELNVRCTKATSFGTLSLLPAVQTASRLCKDTMRTRQTHIRTPKVIRIIQLDHH